MHSADDQTPVIVGVGLISQRVEHSLEAEEPIELMIRAAQRAGEDSGRPSILRDVERIYVPIGRWRYRNPAGLIAKALQAKQAATVSALVGVSQQSVITDACSRIAEGEISTALVAGGEAGYRLLRSRIEGTELHDRVSADLADVVWKPDRDIVPDFERESGLGSDAVGYYAILESAYRFARGISRSARDRSIAAQYHALSRIAAENPDAWDDEVTPVETILGGRKLADPYGKFHVANWSVDQGSALLLMSLGAARKAGVPPSKIVYAHSSAEANHMVNVSARAELERCPGAEASARAALDLAGCRSSELDWVELYSCFPVAMDVYAEALGLSPDAPRSFTGGMPFAGGPFNNFVLHATAQLIKRLRSRPDARGLVSTVSGVLTKQGFSIWGSAPNPNGYGSIDVTDQVRRSTKERPIATDYRGSGRIAGYTVMHDRTGPQVGVAVIDTDDSRRTVARTEDPAVMAAMAAEEWLRRRVYVDNLRFTVAAD
jgi:acetyl-CoA C-acetyltransferase